MITKKELQEALIYSKYPVAFTGSGVSIASGLPTFDTDFYGYHLHDILNYDFFKRNTFLFYKVYLEILKWTYASPSIVHKTLAKMNIPIITQNIDGLHSQAGSCNVVELHGNLEFLYCENCNKVVRSKTLLINDSSNESILTMVTCKSCNCFFRPNLVLINEPVVKFCEAADLIEKTDLLLIIGNSLKVWPANQLAVKAYSKKINTFIINTDCQKVFDLY